MDDRPRIRGADGAGRRRVLIVEDHEATAMGLALILRYEGYEVQAAHDVEAAPERVRAFRPEVVLSDIEVPGFDGHELARRIRGDRGLCAGIRLLAALTGHGGPEDRLRSREAGFDLHLVKPIEPEALLAPIASLEPVPVGESSGE